MTPLKALPIYGKILKCPQKKHISYVILVSYDLLTRLSADPGAPSLILAR